MPHVHRFYVPAEEMEAESGTITLSGDEAHHALHVVRVKVGDAVEVLDGAGGKYACVVEETGRKSVECRIASTVTIEQDEHHLVWAQAWLNHGQTIEDIVKRGTALGVSMFLFFRGDNSERAPKESSKWERWAVEACKQCGRAWLPEFRVVKDLGEALGEKGDVKLLATLDAEPKELREAVVGTTSAMMLMGPEGDFSEAETARALEAGAVPVRLGEHVLRSELAGDVLATLVQHAWGRMG